MCWHVEGSGNGGKLRWGGLFGGVELLLFEKRVSGLHNTASTEMKQRHRKRERERKRKRKKKTCSFDWRLNRRNRICLLPGDVRCLASERAQHTISPASFSPSLFSSGLRRLCECNNIKGLALRMYIVVPVTTWNRNGERWRKARRDGASFFLSLSFLSLYINRQLWRESV